VIVRRPIAAPEVPVKILLLHGPNLNLLGTREPAVYGSLTLTDINDRMTDLARERSVELRTFQSNSEGGLIDALHEARSWADGIVINPGAYAHYSYALRDAIAAAGVPVIEVHLSNIHARESFRHISVLAPVVTGVICGLGWRSYQCGLLSLIGLLQERTT
jgi:3-dehydroquinate dehydratase-2